jgi:hypothetical protein
MPIATPELEQPCTGHLFIAIRIVVFPSLFIVFVGAKNEQ